MYIYRQTSTYYHRTKSLAKDVSYRKKEDEKKNGGKKTEVILSL